MPASTVEFVANNRFAAYDTTTANGATFTAANFVSGPAALDGDDRIIFNQGTGQLFYDADGNGAGAAIQFAVVTAGLALTSASFEVIA